MRRVLTTVTLLGLLVATAAAFAITEHLKQIKSPLSAVAVSVGFEHSASKVMSPVCGCPTGEATIAVRLRHPDRVTLTIVDASHHPVATVASGVRVLAHVQQTFTWKGHTDAGTVAPDGVYHPWVSLAHARHKYRLANRIVVDTKAPTVLSATAGKGKEPVFFAAPGRTVAIRYSLSEPGHALVYLGGRRIIKGRHTKQHAKVNWTGRVDGRPLPAGTYVLSVGAQDIAGNETPASRRKDVTVVVRYLQLVPGRLTVRAGRRFAVRVETAASRYTWRLGRRHGGRRGKTLHLRAPTTPGRYRLVVAEHGHAATAVVRVRR
ncbi:MAG TPA: hypothetical protein VE984_02110 [Gaiellaceae bacterium]|nr:hypothetical protein [Gaiellaceae bacterium]